ncbi:MAG: DUF3866 family protein [Halanaerobiales bacterium]
MYGLSYEQGIVEAIIEEHKTITFFWVKISGRDKCKAVNYNNITGKINPGDQVIVNTTAVELELGTGGYHFVILNLKYLSNYELPKKAKGGGFEEKNYTGHIMKLRYTPMQLRTLSVEEQHGEYHQEIKEFESLEGKPVVIIPLHSMLAPLVISYKSKFPEKKAVYIMSEGGCLALDFSNSVRQLLSQGFLDKTISYGNSFGGDFETVNIFTALATASKIVKADLIIVGMGPGIVGTSTRYGYSGVENAFIEKAVRVLKGRAIIIPRISFADKRKRHYGISHHSITLLTELITDPVELVFPDNAFLKQQINNYHALTRHKISFYSGSELTEIDEVLKASGFILKSMGRKYQDDPLFFITAALAVYKV